jgi:hypothetical protein
MYYFLLLNSSLITAENKFFSLILFGSIAYIITHAIIYYTPLKLLEIFRNYFWVIFALDLFTTSYKIYYNPQIIECSPSANANPIANTSETANMKASLQQIQSKLGDMLSGVNGNKSLTISDAAIAATSITNSLPSVKINTKPIIHNMYDTQTQVPIVATPIQTLNSSASTPIAALKNQQSGNSNNDLYDEMEMFNKTFVSNIGNISTKLPDIIAPTQQQQPQQQSHQIDPDNVSVAGSDIGTFDMNEFANNV